MMRALCDALLRLPEIEESLSRIASGDCPVALGGLSPVHKAHVIAAVRRKTGRPVAALCPDEQEAARLASDVAVLCGEEALTLRSRDFTFHPVETVSREWEHKRLPVLYRMAARTAPVVCGAADAFMQRAMPPETLLAQSVALKPGLNLPPEELTRLLVSGGYKRGELVEGVGQFSRRGGIVDFFSPGGPEPVRLEYFGDEIDTLAYIDPATQRRTQPLTGALLLPCAETLAHAAPGGAEGLVRAIEGIGLQTDADRLRDLGSIPDIDRFMAMVSPELFTALDYLPPKTVVFVCEQARVSERVKNTLWQWGQDIETLLEQKLITPELAVFGEDGAGLWSAVGERPALFLDSFIASSYPLRPHAILNITAKQLPSFGASLETAAGDARHYAGMNYRTLALVPNERRAAHLEELLRDSGVSAARSDGELPPQGGVFIGVGTLSAGMEYPALGLAALTEGQAAPERAKKRRISSVRESSRKRISSYTDLSPGDLVVHEHHGIGRFVGIVPMPVDGIKRDYIKLAYSGTDSLYVPVTQLHLVSKYIGQGDEDGKPAKLNKLGGTEWHKARSKAKAAAKELAKGLIELYAARRRLDGFSFPPDSDWQLSFEESFEYDETDDQLRCVSEIKRDMEDSCPMDRLLCGDVGFGKTEVALRAVMKCVLGGKQAAILVPTTVLAQQHYQTASRRFAGYPVKIEVLSRFRTPAQLKDAEKRIKNGSVDLVIGTHKLLQKDVKFKNLGLLIVDEEQRFGVGHKEKLKELSTQVDVLTLTATPIPRTLNMALSNIRDMSTIEEAPRDRYPVQTFVLEHSWQLLADAIRRELGRGGQVYYLHNRVETIDRVVSRLTEMLPEASIASAHGQMKEEELSEMMRRTADGDIQVLVCTTIIETGIDIPNVNTLIVEDADRLGLAQLHQIRGRVGRSNRHAYAYLTYRRGKILSEVATKRLSAIREFAEFGSGFKIAMRDLEIRGAGNVLGAEQHGHLMSVGYDMYLKLLEEAVLEERGEKSASAVDCSADLSIAASIPEGYIPHAGIRMDIYRRIAALESSEEAEDLIDELIDRFGDVPDGVHSLVRIALLRARAGRAGITEIAQKAERVNIKFTSPDFARISMLCSRKEYKGRVLFSAGDAPYLSLKLLSGVSVLDACGELVDAYADTEERSPRV